jgi:hypothetical protein
MSLSAHVYQIYIAATPEQVWSAITASEWTRRYFHTTEFVEQPRQGRPYRTVGADGGPAIDRLVHGNLENSPLTWENVKDGWVWILNSMKTLLETGQPLPRVREDEPVSS